jgi:hypothetical protein
MSDPAQQPTATPCPECGGGVVIQPDWRQTCLRCDWVWLPPSMRPIVTRPMIAVRLCHVC